MQVVPWLASVAVVGALHPQEPRDVPRLETARAQLDAADLERAKLRRMARARWADERRRVASCYAAVRAYFPESGAVAAEASFRAGELLRCAGETARAIEEYEHARRLGAGSDFGARATLELGHVERRRRAWQRALDRYLEVAGDAAARAHWRDEGAIWAGKTYAAMGELAAARRQLAQVTKSSLDPLVRLRAFNEWAMVFVLVDDVEAACGVLAECRQSLAEHAREQTELGARVRAALARLSCIRAIEHAVARRRGTSVLHGVGEEDE